jgi:hypothetical protein
VQRSLVCGVTRSHKSMLLNRSLLPSFSRFCGHTYRATLLAAPPLRAGPPPALHPPLQHRCTMAAAAPAADAGAKRKKSVIGTHSGTFHCDEALGCYLVRPARRRGAIYRCFSRPLGTPPRGGAAPPRPHRGPPPLSATPCPARAPPPRPQLRQTPAFRDADIIRSRDPDVLATADVVIDVGGVYDAAAQVRPPRTGFSPLKPGLGGPCCAGAQTQPAAAASSRRRASLLQSPRARLPWPPPPALPLPAPQRFDRTWAVRPPPARPYQGLRPRLCSKPSPPDPSRGPRPSLASAPTPPPAPPRPHSASTTTSAASARSSVTASRPSSPLRALSTSTWARPSSLRAWAWRRTTQTPTRCGWRCTRASSRRCARGGAGTRLRHAAAGRGWGLGPGGL